jgi:hypothetical protein
LNSLGESDCVALFVRHFRRGLANEFLEARIARKRKPDLRSFLIRRFRRFPCRLCGSQTHWTKVPYTAVESAGKIILDYVIRRLNGSSARLKMPLGLDLRWDTALRDFQIQLELIRNTLMKTTTARRQPTVSGI